VEQLQGDLHDGTSSQEWGKPERRQS